MTTESAKPWYREPWAWFVLTPLLVVIVMCTIMVSIAFRHADDVVTDNYYKKGRMINQRLEQDLRATELGLGGELRFDLEVGEVLLTLRSDAEYQNPLPRDLLVLLNHPVSADLDRQVVLQEIAPGRYRGDLQNRLEHRWYYFIVPTLDAEKFSQVDWRLTGEIDFAQQSSLVF